MFKSLMCEDINQTVQTINPKLTHKLNEGIGRDADKLGDMIEAIPQRDRPEGLNELYTMIGAVGNGGFEFWIHNGYSGDFDAIVDFLRIATKRAGMPMPNAKRLLDLMVHHDDLLNVDEVGDVDELDKLDTEFYSFDDQLVDELITYVEAKFGSGEEQPQGLDAHYNDVSNTVSKWALFSAKGYLTAIIKGLRKNGKEKSVALADQLEKIVNTLPK